MSSSAETPTQQPGTRSSPHSAVGNEHQRTLAAVLMDFFDQQGFGATSAALKRDVQLHGRRWLPLEGPVCEGISQLLEVALAAQESIPQDTGDGPSSRVVDGFGSEISDAVYSDSDISTEKPTQGHTPSKHVMFPGEIPVERIAGEGQEGSDELGAVVAASDSLDDSLDESDADRDRQFRDRSSNDHHHVQISLDDSNAGASPSPRSTASSSKIRERSATPHSRISRSSSRMSEMLKSLDSDADADDESTGSDSDSAIRQSAEDSNDDVEECQVSHGSNHSRNISGKQQANALSPSSWAREIANIDETSFVSASAGGLSGQFGTDEYEDDSDCGYRIEIVPDSKVSQYLNTSLSDSDLSARELFSSDESSQEHEESSSEDGKTASICSLQSSGCGEENSVNEDVQQFNTLAQAGVVVGGALPKSANGSNTPDARSVNLSGEDADQDREASEEHESDCGSFKSAAESSSSHDCESSVAGSAAVSNTCEDVEHNSVSPSQDPALESVPSQAQEGSFQGRPEGETDEPEEVFVELSPGAADLSFQGNEDDVIEQISNKSEDDSGSQGTQQGDDALPIEPKASSRNADDLIFFDCYDLKIVYERGRTGFENHKDFRAHNGMVIAGRYQVVDFLDSAAFSSALHCIDLEVDEEVCLKVVKNNKEYFDQSLDEIKLLKQVNALDQEDTFNIVRMYDYFYFKEHLFLVTELLKENLYEVTKLYKQDNEAYFTLGRIQKIMKQVLVAIDFLHSQNIIHCDLKPENILILSYSRCEVKVIDLGSSCFTTDHLTSYVQSRSYRAPEVILGHEYGPAIDIWSLGCIATELWTGRVLFKNDSIATILARMIGMFGPFSGDMLKRCKIQHRFLTNQGLPFEFGDERDLRVLHPKHTTLADRLKSPVHGFVDFVQSALTVDPKSRPSASQLLQHPWLNSVMSDDDMAAFREHPDSVLD